MVVQEICTRLFRCDRHTAFVGHETKVGSYTMSNDGRELKDSAPHEASPTIAQPTLTVSCNMETLELTIEGTTRSLTFAYMMLAGAQDEIRRRMDAMMTGQRPGIVTARSVPRWPLE